MLTQIHPSFYQIIPLDSFRIFIISEGYTNTQRTIFLNDCQELVALILKTFPFNITRNHPNWLSVYAAFIPNTYESPSTYDRTPSEQSYFESSFDPLTKTLSFNQNKIIAYLEEEKIVNNGIEIPIYELFQQDNKNRNTSQLVVLLLPTIDDPIGGEFENKENVNNLKFVATSKNGLWHQVVLRSIAYELGLGNEYDMGNDTESELEKLTSSLPYNLEFYESINTINLSFEKKWHKLMTERQRLSPSIHPFDPDSRNISSVLSSTSTLIEFWEGGGGFQRKIWRSSQDCLMRRQIGNYNLPVRSTSVPFCTPCRYYLTQIIYGISSRLLN